MKKQSRAQLTLERDYYQALAEGYEKHYYPEEPDLGMLAEDDVFDTIATPEHYVSHPSGVEPIEITQYETFLRGNIIKYVMRAPYKGSELEDLRKAAQYLEWEIARVELLAHP